MEVFDILKRKSKASNRKGEFTFFDEIEIVEKLAPLNLEEKPIVLFKPNESYWVLLTEKSIVFKKNNLIKKVLYKNLKKRETYFHKYETYLFDKQEILCDHIILYRKSLFTKRIILPIEVLSIFSFSQPLNFIVGK